MAKERSLSERLIRHQALRDSIQKQLTEVKALAESKFGTSDLNQIRRLYAEKSEQNKNSLYEYEQKLNTVESILLDVETRLSNVGK